MSKPTPKHKICKLSSNTNKVDKIPSNDFKCTGLFCKIVQWFQRRFFFYSKSFVSIITYYQIIHNGVSHFHLNCHTKKTLKGNP